MKFVIIPRPDFPLFLEGLKEEGAVHGPQPKENLFVFGPIESADEIAWDYIPTFLPPKKYLLPQRENLLDFAPFDQNGGVPTEPPAPKVVLGLHTCDLAAFQCLDLCQKDKPEDPYYLANKGSLLLLGIECLHKCDRFSNCVSMGTYLVKGGHDLMFTDLGDRFIVQVGTHSGQAILEKTKGWQNASQGDLERLEAVRKKKIAEARAELDIDRDLIPEVFEWTPADSPVWKDVGRRCIACCNCTNVCPTCYCFDVRDEVSLDLKKGSRYRVWDSCQNEEFAQISHGINFRKERSMRQRHRYYRKFKYSVDKYSEFFCIGCGRCTRTCMAAISLIETVNQLAADYRR